MPGYLGFVLITGAVTLLMLFAPKRPRFLANVVYFVAPAYNELPLHFLALTVASVALEYWGGETLRAIDWVGLALATTLVVGLLVLARRALSGRATLIAALDRDLGPGWRAKVEPRLVATLDGGPRWLRIVFAPFFTARSSVERLPNIAYGPHGRENRLDVYRLKRRPDTGGAGAPILIYLHSGGYRSGSKRLGSAELLRRLAAHGWVTISANYRLRPRAGFDEHMEDTKRVIAWARTHATELGADPDTVVLAGGSAGAHLEVIAAQTQNDPTYQPGFETVDTSVSAVIGLYGWYGGYYGKGGADSPYGPLGHDPSGTPPCLIAHGELDTLASIETAERLAAHLRRDATNTVVFAELPGGHHGFDLFYSLRYEAVVDATEAFLGWVMESRRVTPPVQLVPAAV